MPHGESVRSGRKIRDIEDAIFLRHGEVWVIENADVGVHPAVNIAFDGDHDLGFYEFAIER